MSTKMSLPCATNVVSKGLLHNKYVDSKGLLHLPEAMVDSMLVYTYYIIYNIL